MSLKLQRTTSAPIFVSPSKEFSLEPKEAMNTTAGQELVDPVTEVWGATLTSYLSAMGMVVLHYDILLTLKDEVCLIFL